MTASLLLAPLGGVAQEAPLFVDEFAGDTLGPGWTIWDGYAEQQPADLLNHARFEVVGSHLTIGIPGGTEHNQWWFGHAQATRPYEGSGGYEIRLNAGIDGSQQFGLVFQSAPRTFLMFMFYGGFEVAAYVERFVEVDGTQYRLTLPNVGGVRTGRAVPDSGPYYLRVVVRDDPLPSNRRWTFEWSRDGTAWVELLDGIFEGDAPEENIGAIQEVGLFAGNQVPGLSAFEARFDYFRSFPPSAIPVPAPAHLVALAGDQSVELGWQAVADAAEYRVYRSDTSGGPYTEIASTTEPAFTDTGLENGVTYFYVVAARVEQAFSPYSTEQAAVPVPPIVNENVPTEGLLLALEADRLRATLASGQPVVQWNHAYGGVAAATATSSHAPTFVDDAIYGHAAVRFDGVDDYLDLPDGFADFTDGATLILVSRLAALQSGFKFVALGNGGGIDNVVLGRNGASLGLQYFVNDGSGGVLWFASEDVLAIGEPSILLVRQDGGIPDAPAVATLQVNGVDLASGTVTVPPIRERTVNYLGRSFWLEGLFEGDVAELLIYDRTLSASEEQALVAYLDAKYAVTAIPATVLLGGLEQVYDGTPRAVTVTTEPPGLPVVVTYDGSTTPPVAPGSYQVVATITDPDHVGSASGTLVVSPAAHSADGEDNDQDGLVDLADPGCADPTDLSEQAPGLPCDDGADDDGDGFADFRPSGGDPGCHAPASPTESPKCQDGVDNDGAAGIDFDGGASLDLDDDGFVDAGFNPATPAVGAPDPDCEGDPSRDAEAKPSCGLGGEAALLLPLLGALRRRRSSAR